MKQHSSKNKRPFAAPNRDGLKKKPFPGGKKAPVANKARPEKTAKRPVATRFDQNGKIQAQGGLVLWGLHAAREAWLNPNRKCHRLWLTESGQTAFMKTFEEGREEGLARPTPALVEKREIEDLLPQGSVHQGIALEIAPLAEIDFDVFFSGEDLPDLIILLDQVTDPHNVGAVLRSAAAFGAGALITTERNAPNMTGILAKTASGALEHVPMLTVVNLARALASLQKVGYWCVGLAEEGKRDLGDLDFQGRTALVMGAEGDGLRRLTREGCDELVRLPTVPPIGSLNVSNAAAVAMYEARKQKNRKK